ncbi:carboxypeptidase-like regulatory domain-containing protein [Pontibacter ruber]|uniref:Carboxypeptidase-like regulatory domain-containing protein n=1 Tax=Pontibacter ruber TaxID=1343895 RepID=A0ABW5CY02_9BACT|nr:carboxypeptidase-like regulatory domain-containing protein [Pontibacter ruber]
MERSIFLILLCCAFCSNLFAQSIKLQGKVINSDTGQPVAYTSIGVVGKELGTVANALGEFRFSVTPESINDADSVVISSVGFNRHVMPVSELQKGGVTIKLTPQAVTLKEVAVRPQKLKSKVLGKNDREYLTHSVYFTTYETIDDKLGREMGNIIALKKGCFVNDFNFYVSYNQFKSIKFRLNLYSVADGMPGQTLLKEDIIFDVKDQQKGWVKVDLRKYKLRFENLDKVAVTMQWLESIAADEKSKFFGFSTAISAAHKAVRREKSEAPWQKSSTYHSMYFNADCYKDTEAAD